MAEFPKPSFDEHHRTFSFEDFEFDPASGELRKLGTRIRLTPQCQSVLTVLLVRAGTVVTRQELRDLLWPNVFVDYERNLNRTVATLRFRLRDDSDSPRFIETLPTKGYRFIAPVVVELSRVAGTGTAFEPPVYSDPIMAAGEERLHNRTALRWGLLVPGFVAIAVTLAYFLIQPVHHNAIAHAHGQRIIVADFDNTTGDVVFDDALKTGLNASLRQSAFLHVVSDQKISEDISFMGKPATTRLTAQISAEVCQREGGAAYVSGAIAALGKSYALSLKSIDCHTGDVISLEQTTVSSKEKVLDALGRLATNLRTTLGEPNFGRFDDPLPQITTQSLDALKAYSAGLAALRQQGDRSSIPFFEEAIRLDSDFAMAYIALGIRHENLGRSELAKRYISQGFELRSHTSERERCVLSAEYYASVTDELEKATEVAESCQRIYPDDADARGQLVALYMWRGQFEKALAQITAALQQQPQDTTQLSNLIGTYLALNRFGEAEAAAARLKQLMPNASNYYVYRLAFLKGDTDEIKNQEKLAAASNDLLVLSASDDAAAFTGRIRRHQFQSAEVTEEQTARSRLYTALWEAEFQMSSAAIDDAKGALRDDSSVAVRTLAALVFARAGDTADAAKLNAQVAKADAADSLNRLYWGSSISAALAMNGHHPETALSVLQPASSVDLSVDTLIPGGCMYTSYLRGLAFLSLKQASEAVDQFNQIIAHRGLVGSCPVGALARIQLARAYMLSGDVANARSNYQNFLTSWAGADADIPILRQATLENRKIAAPSGT